MAALTPMGIAVLALLVERPMHPYEMYQLLVHRGRDRLLKVRPGSLYHTVDRLAGLDLVVAQGTDRDGNRPERTTYDVTERGRDALRERLFEMLQHPADEYPQFTMALSEAHNLPVDVVLGLLKERIESLDRAVDDASGEATPREKRVYYIGHQFAVDMKRAEIAWLRGLVADIESDAVPWHGHDLLQQHHADASAPTRQDRS